MNLWADIAVGKILAAIELKSPVHIKSSVFNWIGSLLM